MQIFLHYFRRELLMKYFSSMFSLLIGIVLVEYIIIFIIKYWIHHLIIFILTQFLILAKRQTIYK
jgi:hypothetical protein